MLAGVKYKDGTEVLKIFSLGLLTAADLWHQAYINWQAIYLVHVGISVISAKAMWN